MRRKQKKNTEPKLLIDQIIDRMFSGRGCRVVTDAEVQAAEQELIDKGLLSAERSKYKVVKKCPSITSRDIAQLRSEGYQDPFETIYEFHNRVGWPEGFWPNEQEIHE